ncbi:MAG: hypothetical protein QGF68_15930 [Nitrospinota bacterium]|nr:hypothetical protein [Nitrospinota bacterium]
MRSPKAGNAGPFPLGFTVPFLLPYFLTAFVLKVMENGALRRRLDLVDILIVFLKLNLETLLLGVILWPLFYLRRSVRIVPVTLIYLIALIFNFVSYAVSLRFFTPINAFILQRVREYIVFQGLHGVNSPMLWKLGLLILIISLTPFVCKRILIFLGGFRRVSAVSIRFWFSIPTGLAVLGLLVQGVHVPRTRLSATYFEAILRSLAHEYVTRGAVVDKKGVLRKVIPLAPKEKAFWLIPPKERLNVIFYSMESTPYEVFNTENPAVQKLAPGLRSIGKHAVVFRNHYTTSLYSNLAFYSIMSANYGTSLSRFEYVFLKDHILHKLKQAGYTTAILTTESHRMDFLSHVLRNILKFDYVYNPSENVDESKKYKHLSAWYGQSFMVDD